MRGFSLIELLLSITIIGMITGLSMPFFVSFQGRNDLDVTASSLTNALRRAQQYARSGKDDSPWGVQLQTGNSIVYAGTSYIVRDTTEDEVIAMNGISVSGSTNFQFAKLTGLPNTIGSFTLTGNNNETRTITVNAEGMVE